MTELTLIILRGISGSGKSTLAASILDEAKQNGQDGVVFSSDEYFINKVTQQYEFDPSKLGDAHQWNQNRAFEAMKQKQSPIIVDNTHTQRWEAKPYVQEGVKNGYTILVREPTTPWAKNAVELAKRNQHGVPEEAITRMLERWETEFSVEAILQSEPPVRRNNNRGRGRGGRR
jgi:NEDD4-binding protein 2